MMDMAKKDLLANETGKYQGLKNFTPKKKQKYYLSIEANGKWVIEILKPDEPAESDNVKSPAIPQGQDSKNLEDAAVESKPEQIQFSSDVNVILKNGRSIKAISYKENGDDIILYLNYGTLTYPKNSIDKIE